MDLKVYHEEEWQSYPAKTYEEYTYEWLGERNNSESVKLDADGNEVARNRATNPAVQRNTSWSTNRAATWPAEYVDIDDHPLGLTRARHSHNIDPSYSNDILSLYAVGVGNFSTEQTLAMGVWVKSSVPARFTYGSVVGDDTMEAGQWTFIRYTSTSRFTGVRIRPLDDEDVPHGEAWATGAILMFGDTEAEALEKLDTFFDGSTEPTRAWVDFQPRNISGIKRIWPRSETPPPPGTSYEWAGERHASESIKRVDGQEVTRSVQVVAPQLLENGRSLRLDFPIPEGADTYQWRVELRTTETREGYDEAGFHATFTGPERTRGLASRFPADGEWQEYNRTYTIDPEATTGHLELRVGNLSSPWYEVRNLQVAFYADRGWPDYFDGDTESDRANDLWYNADGVPHEWVNGQGWVEL